jgi:membrane protease YdiL (CAAX protease family)
MEPQPPAATTISRARWWTHLVLIAGYLGVSGAPGWARGATGAPALSHSPGRLMLVGAITLAIFGCVFALAWLASRASRDDLLLRWRGGFWTVPIGLGYSVALRVMLAVVGVPILAVLVLARVLTAEALQRLVPRVDALLDISAMRHDPLYFWLTVTFVSFVMAGLREELWRSAFLAGLRALWPQRFGSRAGQVAAVLIVAMVFGLAHITMGLFAACAAGLLGLGLGLIMVLHRSIWPAVLAHGAFDATSMALIPWAMEQLHRLRQLQQL